MASPFPQQFTSTVSHWQATNRGPSALWDHGRDAPLPSNVDFLIVGGGITGASLAYQLTRPGGAGVGKHIAVVEAKDLASGATGRNGGHIGPCSWLSFPSLTASLQDGGAGIDAEAALDVIFNEADTLALAAEIVRSENLDVDFWKGHKMEVFTTEAGAAKNAAAREAFEKARRASKYANRELEWTLVTDPVEAQRISRTEGAVAVNIGTAGSNHPHRLATALMKLAMEARSSKTELYTHTPVLKLSETQGGWAVETTRGSIRAENVVLCTNAWTRHLFPEDMERKTGIAAHVTPFRGHAALVVPPASYSGEDSIQNTFAVENGPYLMATPHSGLVFGVYNSTALAVGLAGWDEIFGVEDDSVVLDSFKDWLVDYCPKGFVEWGDELPGEGVNQMWTGIMAASADQIPLIGAVPGKAGLWAAVAFHGHGMARILTATQSLAANIKTGEWDSRLPRVFEITEQRLEKGRSAAAIPRFQQS